MASNGIRDRVAIVGMGCTPFGEHWDKGASDLLVDATGEALTSAGIELRDVDAFWLGTLFSGQSGLTLSRPLKIDYKPVSRLENYCATGSEAFRNACYAVASGAYDVAMAIGVEKLKDSGYSGLPGSGGVGDGTRAALTAPATFSLLAPAYAKKFGVDEAQFKDVITRIDGVGDTIVFGARDYSMRVWLDPAQIQARGLTASDVIAANLFSDLLIEILPNFKRSGWLILSGIVRTQEGQLIAALGRTKFNVVRVKRRGKWITILARGSVGL